MVARSCDDFVLPLFFFSGTGKCQRVLRALPDKLFFCVLHQLGRRELGLLVVLGQGLW